MHPAGASFRDRSASRLYNHCDRSRAAIGKLAMNMLFRNELHEDFGSWPIAYIPYGGADFGEIRAVAEAVGDGDDGAFYEAWVAVGDRLKGEAEAALSAGYKVSARELYLRASVFYAASYHPLYGAPVDPR